MKILYTNNILNMVCLYSTPHLGRQRNEKEKEDKTLLLFFKAKS